MHKQTINFILILIPILLFSACGPFETAPAPVDAPVLIVTVTENAPTAVVVTEGSDPEKISQYIGLSYPPLPAGLSERFSMLIQGSDVHSLSLVLDAANKMLWLSKITHYDANGAVYWQVKDVLDLSTVEAGLILVPDGCSVNGVSDNEIFAASKNGIIQLTWRANTTLDRFESIPVNGIECRSDKGISLE
ncbi:MAG: hypothetical protein M3R47_04080 [Chloroflexota bacterium]|nr:hypothetical protein [Chloroflexota bacterium]